ncbi:hypothetical protein HDV00_011438 [Rhizophlyctis rosea]|nr:hypothetical protein HDV00_011438 [Rhizophlyctis rosea]
MSTLLTVLTWILILTIAFLVCLFFHITDAQHPTQTYVQADDDTFASYRIEEGDAGVPRRKGCLPWGRKEIVHSTMMVAVGKGKRGKEDWDEEEHELPLNG